MFFDYVMNQFGEEHLFTVTYIVNLVLAAIAYKLGFAKKLSIVKSVVVYILLAVGVFVLNIMFIVMPIVLASNPLPIAESLVIICLVLAIYRIRLYMQRRQAE